MALKVEESTPKYAIILRLIQYFAFAVLWFAVFELDGGSVSQIASDRDALCDHSYSTPFQQCLL